MGVVAVTKPCTWVLCAVKLDQLISLVRTYSTVPTLLQYLPMLWWIGSLYDLFDVIFTVSVLFWINYQLSDLILWIISEKRIGDLQKTSSLDKKVAGEEKEERREQPPRPSTVKKKSFIRQAVDTLFQNFFSTHKT